MQGPVLRYLDDVREGTPIADMATVVTGRSARDAALAAMRELPDRLVATQDEALARALLIEGAAEKRHMFVMQCDLRAYPGDDIDDGAHLAPWPTTVDPVHFARILGSWREAFPASHPDHFSGDDKVAIEFMLALVSGRELGPMHRCSALVEGPDGTAFAGIIVTIRPHDRPYGGAWITDLWCDPRMQGTGVGHRLINRAKCALSADDHHSLYLAVTASNPAIRLYEREGFRTASESRTLVIPKARI